MELLSGFADLVKIWNKCIMIIIEAMSFNSSHISQSLVLSYTGQDLGEFLATTILSLTIAIQVLCKNQG